MRRPPRSVVGFCIVVIGLSAVLPGISALECALIEPQWVLLADETPVAVDSTVEPANEQPLPLLSFLPSPRASLGPRRVATRHSIPKSRRLQV